MAPGLKGIKLVHEKVHETFDFPEIESVMILHFYLKAPKRRWSRFEPERICYQAIFFRRKSADASQTKRKDEPPDRRLNHNLPRLRWNRRESMSFYTIFRMRSIDKNKNSKTTKTKTLSFVQLWPNSERRGKIMVGQVCLLLKWSLICLTKLPLS